MNDILINGFVDRIKADLMTIEQVPIPYQDRVRELVKKRKGVRNELENKTLE